MDAAPHGREAVLLVDDNDGVREATARALASLGYTVLQAASGQEALGVLRGDATVDLLFTDIVMPGLGGVELAERAALLRPGLAVLFASGYAGDASQAVPARYGMLGKPYRRGDLATRLREVLAGS